MNGTPILEWLLNMTVHVEHDSSSSPSGEDEGNRLEDIPSMNEGSHSQGVPAITLHPWATISSFFFLNILFMYLFG